MELALRSFSHEKGYSAPWIEYIGIDGFQSWDAMLLSVIALYLCIRLLPRIKMERKKSMKQKLKKKLRTHKAMAKRLRVTASGKFMRRKVAISHLRRNKSPKAVRSADKEFQLKTADTRRLKRLLPYAF